jgi:Mg-chelatase subunit ChlD
MTIELFGLQFQQPIFIYLGILAVVLFLFINRKVRGKALAFLLLRCVVIFTIFTVLATPYMAIQEELLQDKVSVILISDQTGSIQLFNPGLATEAANAIQPKLSELSELVIINITTENSSALGDSIYSNLVSSSTKSSVVVLVSDGNNNEGRDTLDVASFASASGSRIYTLSPDLMSQEVLISSISGSNMVPVASEYSGDVVIKKLGGTAAYTLQITADSELIHSSTYTQEDSMRKISFAHSFSVKGSHNISAKIIPSSQDLILINNELHKTVNVIEKPRVLLITKDESSPLRTVLGQIYDMSVYSMLPPNLSPYSAIIIDDLTSLDVDSTILRDFLNDGGGILVAGGADSYENGEYLNSKLENILPVRSTGSPEQRSKKLAFVILIDVSGSTGGELGANSKIDVEKALAVKMIRDLSGEDAYIGIVAFNSDGYVISSLKKSETNIAALEDRISRLDFGGGTYAFSGQAKARELLEGFEGSKYIVMVSDGITNYPRQSYLEAEKALIDGIKTYSVGVGFDTDVAFMMGLAKAGGGVYFAPDESERIKISLKGAEQPDEETEEGYFLITTDRNHFITQDADFSNISISDFNTVTAKSAAQALVSTQSLEPILSVWRFGLGRVAALSTDNGNLWATSLYDSSNSRLITATVNWILGDSSRADDISISCEDIRYGEFGTAIIHSADGASPSVTLDGAKQVPVRLDEDDFYINIAKQDRGNHVISSGSATCVFVVNYPQEFASLGSDSETLSRIASISGGNKFMSTQLSQLAEEVSAFSSSESMGLLIEHKNMQVFISLLALLLFTLDVCLRRIREILGGRNEASDVSAPDREKSRRKSKKYNVEKN